jgi:ribosomal protein S14
MKIGHQLHRSCANCSDESELVIEWDAGGRLYLCRQCAKELVMTVLNTIPLSEEEE